MKLFTGLTKIAHVPPHAKVVFWDNVDGYWTTNQDNHKIFLRAKDNKVWIPKLLRGRNPGDISPRDFDSIPREESGDASYKLWLEDFNRADSANRLFDGAAWSDKGKILVDRLKKYIIKSKLDNATNFGLPLRYSVRPEYFDALLQQTNLEQVRSMGRNIGKKYRILTELLRESGKSRLANKIDSDFYYHWNKLQALFDFDPSSYEPKKQVAGEDEAEEKSQTETIQNITDSFLETARNIMDPQMSEFMNALSDFMKVVGKNNIPLAQKAYTNMTTILMKYIGQFGNHPVGQAAEQILQLPSFILLHHKLFEDSTP